MPSHEVLDLLEFRLPALVGGLPLALAEFGPAQIGAPHPGLRQLDGQEQGVAHVHPVHDRLRKVRAGKGRPGQIGLGLEPDLCELRVLDHDITNPDRLARLVVADDGVHGGMGRQSRPCACEHQDQGEGGQG